MDGGFVTLGGSRGAEVARNVARPFAAEINWTAPDVGKTLIIRWDRQPTPRKSLAKVILENLMARNSTRRPSVFGRVGAVGFLSAVSLVVAQIIRGAAGARSDSQGEPILWASIVVGLVVAASFLALVGWKSRSVRLGKALLAERGDGLFFVCSGAKSTTDAVAGVNRLSKIIDGRIRAINRSGGGDRNGRLPSWFTVFAAKEGIQIWAPGRTPRAVLDLSWEDVARIEISEVEEFTRRSNSLTLQVPVGLEPLVLPLIAVGRGVGGLFPLRRIDLETIRRALVDSRQAALL